MTINTAVRTAAYRRLGTVLDQSIASNNNAVQTVSRLEQSTRTTSVSPSTVVDGGGREGVLVAVVPVADGKALQVRTTPQRKTVRKSKKHSSHSKLTQV